jgi:hypothetical protein
MMTVMMAVATSSIKTAIIINTVNNHINVLKQQKLKCLNHLGFADFNLRFKFGSSLTNILNK